MCVYLLDADAIFQRTRLKVLCRVQGEYREYLRRGKGLNGTYGTLLQVYAGLCRFSVHYARNARRGLADNLYTIYKLKRLKGAGFFISAEHNEPEHDVN